MKWASQIPFPLVLPVITLLDIRMSTSYIPPSHPTRPEEELPALPERIADEDIDKPQREHVIQVRTPISTAS